MHDVPGSHWHEPSAGKRAGFGKFGRPKTPYDLFMESEGIPVFRDIGISKVQNLPLAPWKRTGGRGSYIQLHGTEGKWGNYVIEVPGAGALNPEKHIYEEIYFVVEGRGTTEVWLDNDSKRHVFEWQKGSLFSIPVNAWHRIVNASSAPALLLAGTTAPMWARSSIARTSSATASRAPTTSTSTRTTSSPIRCAVSPCGAPTSCPTSSTATCRSTTAARPASAASSRS
jgi:mannose-6-phosphate isomerase-like protein (cupin superfamily)